MGNKSNVGPRRPVVWTRGLAALAAVICALALVGVIQAAGGLPGVQSPLPPAKATVVARSDQAIATARARHPTKPAHVTPPPAAPTPTLTAGIIQTHQGPFPNTAFSVANMYRGPVSARWEVVFAGTAWTTFPAVGSGALRVYTITGDLISVFPAPDSSTTLRITGVTGAILRLQSDTGAALSFNLETNTFGG